jgi:hypothetical protein
VKGRVHLDSIPHILYIFIHFPPFLASPVLFKEGSLSDRGLDRRRDPNFESIRQTLSDFHP